MLTMRPARAADEERKASADHVERAGEVDVQHGAEVLAGHAHGQAVAHDAGVVDQHRDGAELRLHFLDRRFGGRAVGDVALYGEGAVAGLFKQRDRLVRRVPAAGGRVWPRRSRPARVSGQWRGRCRGLPPVTRAILPFMRVPPKVFCRSSGFSTLKMAAPGMVLRMRPESVLPAPTSMNVSTPASAMRSTLSCQRTGWQTCVLRSCAASSL